MELKTLVKRYRVTLEESYDVEKSEGKTFEKWRYQEVRGRYGVVYPYSKDQLAVTFTSNIINNRHKRTGWKLIQDGDIEKTYLFPLANLQEVLVSIRPRKKLTYSPEYIEVLKKRIGKVNSKRKERPENS